jgi:regulator of protease activity HflC (stomatin/prohibitin superfamily)
LDAQAEVARANGEAEAKKVRADAQAYENQKIAQNLTVMQAQWNYEINLEKAKRWNGKEVSDQALYVPNTYDLRSGK